MTIYEDLPKAYFFLSSESKATIYASNLLFHSSLIYLLTFLSGPTTTVCAETRSDLSRPFECFKGPAAN